MTTIPPLIIDHSLDGETRFPEIVGILTFCSILSTAVVSLRVYTRWHLIHAFGIDDIVIVVAQFMTLAVAVTIGLEAQFGLGRHVWTMDPAIQEPYLKTFYASIVIYNFATPLVKISILLMYKRIFASPTMQRICLGALCFMVLYAISFPLTLALSCIPIPKFWDQTIPGTCIQQHLADPIMGAVNIATDIFLLFLPMPAIKSLQLPQKQKYMLYGVFCLSFFTIGIALYRIKPLIDSTITPDPTWDNTRAATFSYLEITIGTMASCLPTLRPLVARFLPSAIDNSGYNKHFDSNENSSGSGNGRTAMPRSGKWPSDAAAASREGNSTDAILLVHDIELGTTDRSHVRGAPSDLGYHVSIGTGGGLDAPTSNVNPTSTVAITPRDQRTGAKS